MNREQRDGRGTVHVYRENDGKTRTSSADRLPPSAQHPPDAAGRAQVTRTFRADPACLPGKALRRQQVCGSSPTIWSLRRQLYRDTDKATGRVTNSQTKPQSGQAEVNSSSITFYFNYSGTKNSIIFKSYLILVFQICQ